MEGFSLLGYERATSTGDRFQAVNPVTGEFLPGSYYSATAAEVDVAAEKARGAANAYGDLAPAIKAAFLEAIAEEILKIQPELVARASLETALSIDRLNGETARTVGQLRLFASVVRTGKWVDARIETALPERQPIPKPDIRSMLVPLGPVAVFGASNFPLAFSVAGGDTAAALAAGNPVVVKAHPAHPGTSLLVGEAVLAAARKCVLPDGVFSLLFSPGHKMGELLVQHPAIKAVGFTGSRTGGLALAALAAARPEPIPVFAEMSSVNPLILTPEALSDPVDLATRLLQSVTLGAGQFCTKPGLVFLVDGPETKGFLNAYATRAGCVPAMSLLHGGIADSYRTQVTKRAAVPGITVLTKSEAPDEVHASAFCCDAATFRNHTHLAEEIFGPAVLFVIVSDKQELESLLSQLEGQLTASIFCPDEQVVHYETIVATLRRRAGRLIFNQFPTGVEVCEAMVHGGPFPSTSDGRSTSVGTMAILRFARPACWQNAPQSILPAALTDSNPLGILRMVNGQMIS